MMNSGRHTGRVQAQLVPAGHMRPHCQLHDARIQGLQRFGPDELTAADHRGIVGHTAEVHETEPAQHQPIGYALFRLLEAPVVQVFDQQETQDSLHQGRMPSPINRVGKTPRQVSFDLLKELIILEQDIERY